MIRAQGSIQEITIRIVCVALVGAALYGCSQSDQSAASRNAALAATPAQNTEMAEVVISTSRPQPPGG
jgi:hypothetical protein